MGRAQQAAPTDDAVLVRSSSQDPDLSRPEHAALADRVEAFRRRAGEPN
jgi:hypothetical protein